MSGEDDTHFDHFVRTRLTAGENPIMFLAGWSDEGPQAAGCLVLTSLRACFCRKGEPAEAFRAVSVAAIQRAEMHSTPSRRELRLISAEGDLVFASDQAEEAFERLYHRIEALMSVGDGVRETVERIAFNPQAGWDAPPEPARIPPAKPAAPPAPQAFAARAAVVATIDKLEQLHAAGIVSSQEFEAKKRELLARLQRA